MNDFYGWENDHDQPIAPKETLETLIEYSESKIRWGIIAAIVVIISTCIFLLAYC